MATVIGAIQGFWNAFESLEEGDNLPPLEQMDMPEEEKMLGKTVAQWRQIISEYTELRETLNIIGKDIKSLHTEMTNGGPRSLEKITNLASLFDKSVRKTLQLERMEKTHLAETTIPSVENLIIDLKEKFVHLKGAVITERKEALNDFKTDKSCELIRTKIEGYISIFNDYYYDFEQRKKPTLRKIDDLTDKLAKMPKETLTPAQIEVFSLKTAISPDKTKTHLEAYDQIHAKRKIKLNILNVTYSSLVELIRDTDFEIKYYIETYKRRGVAPYKSTTGSFWRSSPDPELDKTEFTPLTKVSI